MDRQHTIMVRTAQKRAKTALFGVHLGALGIGAARSWLQEAPRSDITKGTLRGTQNDIKTTLQGTLRGHKRDTSDHTMVCTVKRLSRTFGDPIVVSRHFWGPKTLDLGSKNGRFWAISGPKHRFPDPHPRFRVSSECWS